MTDQPTAPLDLEGLKGHEPYMTALGEILEFGMLVSVAGNTPPQARKIPDSLNDLNTAVETMVSGAVVKALAKALTGGADQ